jgi:hypothetical protein
MRPAPSRPPDLSTPMRSRFANSGREPSDGDTSPGSARSRRCSPPTVRDVPKTRPPGGQAASPTPPWDEPGERAARCHPPRPRLGFRIASGPQRVVVGRFVVHLSSALRPRGTRDRLGGRSPHFRSPPKTATPTGPVTWPPVVRRLRLRPGCLTRGAEARDQSARRPASPASAAARAGSSRRRQSRYARQAGKTTRRTGLSAGTRRCLSSDGLISQTARLKRAIAIARDRTRRLGRTLAFIAARPRFLTLAWRRIGARGHSPLAPASTTRRS